MSYRNASEQQSSHIQTTFQQRIKQTAGRLKYRRASSTATWPLEFARVSQRQGIRKFTRNVDGTIELARDFGTNGWIAQLEAIKGRLQGGAIS